MVYIYLTLRAESACTAKRHKIYIHMWGGGARDENTYVAIEQARKFIETRFDNASALEKFSC